MGVVAVSAVRWIRPPPAPGSLSAVEAVGMLGDPGPVPDGEDDYREYMRDELLRAMVRIYSRQGDHALAEAAASRLWERWVLRVARDAPLEERVAVLIRARVVVR